MIGISDCVIFCVLSFACGTLLDRYWPSLICRILGHVPTQFDGSGIYRDCKKCGAREDGFDEFRKACGWRLRERR